MQVLRRHFMNGRPLLATLIGSLCVFLIARLTVADSLTNVVSTRVWQLSAPAWLTGKSLWSTVLSFHAQPPALVMLQWAAANVWPNVIGVSLLLAVAIFVCCCGVIAACITKSRVAGILTALVIAFAPATLLYSHWFFSSIYLAAFLSLNVLFVRRWAVTGNSAWLAWAAFILATASLFHAAYFGAFLVVVTLMLLYSPVRRFELRRPAFAIPLLFAAFIAFFTPVKNFIVFGFFSPSSWGLINIANVYTKDRFIWQDCRYRVLNSQRKIGDFGGSKAAAFREILNQDMLFQTAKPNGEVNLNHLDVMQCTDRTKFIKKFSSRAATLNVVRSLTEAVILPAWDYPWVGAQNLKRIKYLVKPYELYVMRGDEVEFRYYDNIDERPDDWLASLPSLSSLLIAVTVIFACLTLIADFGRFWRCPGGPAAVHTTRRQITQIYPCILALLILAIFVFASGQELNRVKFSLTPLFVATVLEAFRRYADFAVPDWLRKLRLSCPLGKSH